MAHDTHNIPVVCYYIRADRFHLRATQMAEIDAHGRTEENVYVEGERTETWADAANHCDEGEAVGVVGLDRIPGTWISLIHELEDLRERGVFVYDIEAGHVVDPASVATAYKTKLKKDDVRRMPSREVAAERGAKAKKNPGAWKGASVDEKKRMLAIWNASETVTEGAAALGVTRVTVYRWMQKDGFPPHPSTIDTH